MSSIDRHGGEVEEFDVQLSSGWVRAARLSASGPLVLCLPGLSANLRSFDVIGHRLADAGFQVVAIDLRGRGRSERTPPGTFGWPAHARDAAEVAGHLGVESMCLIGWSMGAFVTMQLAEIEPRLLRKVVLIDACGAPRERAMDVIRRTIERLGVVVYSSSREYIELVQQAGMIERWGPFWKRYFEYELETVNGGVRPRTCREAVMEDFEYGTSHDPSGLWAAVTMPALLLRAARPLGPGGPFIVDKDHRDAFVRSVPTAKVVEVDANHYDIVTDTASADAILDFLEA